MKMSDSVIAVPVLTAEFKDPEWKLQTFMRSHATDLEAWENALTPSFRKLVSARVLHFTRCAEGRALLCSRSIFICGRNWRSRPIARGERLG